MKMFHLFQPASFLFLIKTAILVNFTIYNHFQRSVINFYAFILSEFFIDNSDSSSLLWTFLLILFKNCRAMRPLSSENVILLWGIILVISLKSRIACYWRRELGRTSYLSLLKSLLSGRILTIVSIKIISEIVWNTYLGMNLYKEIYFSKKNMVFH